jgi:hypothetical protein
LARALIRCTGSDEARFVFDLGGWRVERAKDQNCLIATLKTTDGFEVCFGVPFETCRHLGQTLQQGAEEPVAAGAVNEEAIASGRSKLN